MGETDALSEFKEGLKFLSNNYANKALPHFTRAAEMDQHNPFYLSYLGLALAAAEKRWAEAEEICDAAVRKRRTEAQLYLNLYEVYRLQGNRLAAIETLTTGLQYTKQDVRLVRALRKMGVRRPPVLPFLDRNQFFNMQLGRLRHRILQRLGKE